MAGSTPQSPPTTQSMRTTTPNSPPKNPYPFPDPNASMHPTHNNPISGLPLDNSTDLSLIEILALPEDERNALAKRMGVVSWEPFTVMAIGTPADAYEVVSREVAEREMREARPLPDEDEDEDGEVDGGVDDESRKKDGRERERPREQNGGSIPAGRVELLDLEPGPIPDEQDGEEGCGAEQRGIKRKELAVEQEQKKRKSGGESREASER